MSVSSIDGYLTKKEIEESFNRSHRSLTRDFSNAVRVGDSKVLPHLKLRTDDGNELVGTEVTLQMIQELSNRGLSPTWYAKQEWVQNHYDKEASNKKKSESKTEINSATNASPASTSTDNELVATLKSQISRLEQENDRRYDEHQQDKQSSMEQIKMFKDMFDTLKEDHTDTKELLKEVHQVMGKFADVSLLGSQTRPSVTEDASTTPAQQASIVDLGNNSAVDAVVVEKPKKVKKIPKKKSTTTTKSKSTAKPKRSAQSKSKQYKWYETPTLNRFISRK